MAAPFGAGIRSCKPKKEKSGRPRIASSKKEKLTARKKAGRQIDRWVWVFGFAQA